METRRSAKRKKLEGGHSVTATAEENQNAVVESGDELLLYRQTKELNAIFGNDVIFCLIGDYLLIPDLKILRQTCKMIWVKVNTHRKFLPNLRLTITNETLKEKVLTPNSALEWKSVKIVLDLTSRKNFPLIPTKGISDLYLLFDTTALGGCLSQQTLDRVAASRNGVISMILEPSRYSNLESLTLHMNVFCYEMPATALTGILGTVKHLSFGGEADKDYFYDYLTNEEVRNLKINMTMIGSLTWRLKSFSMLGEGYTRVVKLVTRTVGKILASSANSIEEINAVNCDFGDAIEIHERIQFPLLRHLKFSLNKNDGIPFAQFLNRQPKLELLMLVIDKPFIPPLLKAVKANCSSKLHTLQFTSPTMLNDIPDLNSWTFIRNLSGLKKFMVGGDNYPGNVLMEILGLLPASLESLEILSIHWPKETQMSIPRSRLTSVLSGFTALTYLRIMGCRKLFNDEILQSICRDLSTLRTLEFDAKFVKDFGLTGEKDGRSASGIALSNLKALRELKIYSKGEITEQGLVKAIRFLELRVLDLPEHFVSNPALIEIASNNPSLESVTRMVSRISQTEIEQRKLFSRIQAVNPRLTKLTTVHNIEDYASMPVGGPPPKIIHRPSYGVPSTPLDDSFLRKLLGKMKFGNARYAGPQDYDHSETKTYYFDLGLERDVRKWSWCTI